MKRITSICLVFFAVFMLFAGAALGAVDFDYTVYPNAVMLIDANSGEILYKKNIDERIKPASTTKILTLITALENSSMDEIVEVSRDAAGVSGSSLDLVRGEEVVMKDLLSGMMMVSGNDAATAVAEHIDGSTADFVERMNALAQDIGMTNSNFDNVHGKDEDDHYVTVADMALLAQYAFKNEEFMQIVNRESYDMPATNQRSAHTEESTNHLMRKDDEDYYRYATGMKTGLTPDADGCLVASAQKDGTDLICLIFGDNSSGERERWKLAPELFDYGFDSYTTVNIADLLKNVEPIQAQVENYAANDETDGLLEFAPPASADLFITMEKSVAQAIIDGTDTVEAVETYTVPVPLQAPILEGDIVGSVTYRSAESGTILYTGNLVATRDVLEAGTEVDARGGTAVATLPPTVPEEIVTDRDNPYVWFWLIIPVALIVFLLVRLMTVNRSKRKRFSKKRRPHYSYRIRK